MFYNPQNMIRQFQQFKNTFSGDPREEVQRLLDTGQMSQETYSRLSEQATQLQKFFNTLQG